MGSNRINYSKSFQNQNICELKSTKVPSFSKIIKNSIEIQYKTPKIWPKKPKYIPQKPEKLKGINKLNLKSFFIEMNRLHFVYAARYHIRYSVSISKSDKCKLKIGFTNRFFTNLIFHKFFLGWVLVALFALNLIGFIMYERRIR